MLPVVATGSEHVKTNIFGNRMTKLTFQDWFELVRFYNFYLAVETLCTGSSSVFFLLFFYEILRTFLGQNIFVFATLLQALEARFCPPQYKSCGCCMNIHWATLQNRSLKHFHEEESFKGICCLDVLDGVCVWWYNESGAERWTRLASGFKRHCPITNLVSSEEILEIKLSITTLLHFFHITGVGTRYSVINISSSESLSLEESTPKDQSDLSAMLASQLGEREDSGCLWDTFFQRLST